MIDDIISLIQDAPGCLESDKEKMIDWLKSLKRWKPSKEQLEALKYFISFHKPQANAAVEWWK